MFGIICNMCSKISQIINIYNQVPDLTRKQLSIVFSHVLLIFRASLLPLTHIDDTLV